MPEQKVKAEAKLSEDVFLKEDLLKSKRFSRHIDLLNAMLEHGKKYTISEVQKMIDGFMNGEVN